MSDQNKSEKLIGKMTVAVDQKEFDNSLTVSQHATELALNMAVASIWRNQDYAKPGFDSDTEAVELWDKYRGMGYADLRLMVQDLTQQMERMIVLHHDKEGQHEKVQTIINRLFLRIRVAVSVMVSIQEIGLPVPKSDDPRAKHPPIAPGEILNFLTPDQLETAMRNASMMRRWEELRDEGKKKGQADKIVAKEFHTSVYNVEKLRLVKSGR